MDNVTQRTQMLVIFLTQDDFTFLPGDTILSYNLLKGTGCLEEPKMVSSENLSLVDPTHSSILWIT